MATRAQRARGEGAWRQQMRRHEAQVGEAARLRRQADAMDEDISWLIGQVDEARQKYGADNYLVAEGEATIRRLRADQKRLCAQATQLERRGA